MGEMPDLAVGMDIGGCRLERVIGRGGMGIVYLGRDLALDRPVAVKLIASEHSGDDSVRRLFEREARLMAAIDHPNVIPVYAAGEEGDHLYIVMRYVDGTDLRRLLAESGPLDPVRAGLIVEQIARALDAAHDRGLVHRDIKPANVLLSGDHAYLTDFGITRLIDERTRGTDTGELVGTLDFMSPEQVRGQATDARSDVYSLGCVLYACLTGDSPFQRPTAAATMEAHLQEDPPAVSQAAGVSRRFDPVLARAMAKRPEDRYQSAGLLGKAVLAAAQDSGHRSRGTAVMVGGSDGSRSGEAATIVAGSSSDPTASAAPTVAAPPAVKRRTVAHTLVSPDAVGAAPVHHGRPASRQVVAAGALLLAAAIAALVVLLASGSAKPAGPLTRVQVSRVIHAFASAYGRRDAGAISRLLSARVVRVSPSANEHGRRVVLADYRAQFRSVPVPVRYTLRHLRVTPGWAARATADFTLKLRGGGSEQGHVVFGLQRARGRPRIGLIATRET
jgi:hypothetical protein